MTIEHPVQLQVSFDGSRLVFHGSMSMFQGGFMVFRGVVCFVRQGYESNVVWKKHDMVIHLLTSMDRGLSN